MENIEQALFLSTVTDEFAVGDCRGDISCELEAGIGELTQPDTVLDQSVIEPIPLE